MTLELETASLRSGTTSEWASGPVLGVGEFGVDLDTKEVKVGDGSAAFADLSALTPVLVSVTLVAGTKVTADTKIKATSKIIPVVKTLGTVTAPQAMRVSRSAGVSFTVTSADGTDTSVLDVYVWH